MLYWKSMRKELVAVSASGKNVDRVYWLRAVTVVFNGMSLGMSLYPTCRLCTQAARSNNRTSCL